MRRQLDPTPAPTDDQPQIDRRFARYVAIGDSSTEGLDDPDSRGGYRGWANRLAEHVARANGGSVLYANLGIRGRQTREILEQQLEPALAMAPDLATIFAGTNDVVSKHFDLDQVAADLAHIHHALVDVGATVLTFTLPDLTPVLPAAKRLAPRIGALNAAIREVAATAGTTVVDFAAYPVSSDSRLWSDDRLHANALGHARIAAGLAHALGLPGTSADWHAELPPRPRASLLGRASREFAWLLLHFVPWLWRHSQGRSSGDGRLPKRPRLTPFEVPATEPTGSPLGLPHRPQ